MVLHAGIQHQQIPGAEPVVLTCRVELYFAVQHMDGDGAVRAMRSDLPTALRHNQCHSKGPVFHQRAGVSSVASEQHRVVHASPFLAEMNERTLLVNGRLSGGTIPLKQGMSPRLAFVLPTICAHRSEGGGPEDELLQ